MPKGHNNTIDTFWARIEKTDTCWLWQGPTFDRHGYGRFAYKQKLYMAHRFMWMLTFGEIPHNLEVAHSCHVHACCNPEHLYLATHKENMNDQSPGQHRPIKLTAEDVRAIRVQAQRGESARELALTYGVSLGTISKVVMRRIWKHIY